MDNEMRSKKIYMTERSLSIVVFSLFFSWILAFPLKAEFYIP